MRAWLWGRASAEKVPAVPAEEVPEPPSKAEGPRLTAEQEQQLRESVTTLAMRLEALGSEPPASEGSEAVAVRVVGRERGRKEVLPLPGFRVRFGWKRQQVEVSTDVSGWAVARLPVGMERGAYRVSVLNEEGRVLAARKGTATPGEKPPPHHIELRARAELQEHFERGRQWREEVARTVMRINENARQWLQSSSRS
ncbi:MAG: hypothetical protein JXB05_02505 [Myxococcaceae bacterium]|nr:hypothetical protein [Myxococcaceae bacterium]